MFISDIKYVASLLNEKLDKLNKRKGKLTDVLYKKEDEYSVEYCKRELYIVNLEISRIERCLEGVSNI